ncbi:forkhead box protein D4-like 3, partial [Triticum urartu]|uniref:forkhead box protein D4-like 3 n=1 Tax=Triticum urartu TaxID=4572 RepID=UPI0020432787
GRRLPRPLPRARHRLRPAPSPSAPPPPGSLPQRAADRPLPQRASGRPLPQHAADFPIYPSAPPPAPSPSASSSSPWMAQLRLHHRGGCAAPSLRCSISCSSSSWRRQQERAKRSSVHVCCDFQSSRLTISSPGFSKCSLCLLTEVLL